MLFIYLSLGILAVIIIHSLITLFVNADPSTVRRNARRLWYLLLIIGIFVLLRFGLPHMAAIMSFFTVALPLWDRYQASRRQQKAQNDAPHDDAPVGQMSEKQAREILDIEEGASRKEIIDAHKRLIQKNHPDSGGSDYLASQINKARDVLLKKDDS